MLEKVMQNGPKITKNDAKMSPKLVQNLSKYRLKDLCNICGPKIDEKSSLGAPKGRQSDFAPSAK